MAEEFSLKEALAGMTEAQKGGVFPEQEVTCKCIEAEYKVSKQGTRGWGYVGEILEGEQQGETVEGTAWWSTKKKGSLPFFLNQMTSLGITEVQMVGDDSANPPIPALSNDELAAAMVGAVFTGQITIDSGVGARARKRNQLIAVAFLGDVADEAGELGGGEDELAFDEFLPEAPAAVATDVSAGDDAIEAANTNPPVDPTGEDQPVSLDDPLEALWEPSAK